VFGVAICFALSGNKNPVASQGYVPEDLRNPRLGLAGAAFCGNTGVTQAFICDPDHLLAPETKLELKKSFDQLTFFGREPALVIVKSIKPAFIEANKDVDSAGEMFATILAQTWNKQTANIGVLVFISVLDQVTYVKSETVWFPVSEMIKIGPQRNLLGKHRYHEAAMIVTSELKAATHCRLLLWLTFGVAICVVFAIILWETNRTTGARRMIPTK
jgi:hypothetical protein